MNKRYEVYDEEGNLVSEWTAGTAEDAIQMHVEHSIDILSRFVDESDLREDIVRRGLRAEEKETP
jgi:uncharacterized protein YutE (UPF0331/DUF86 family)